MNVLGVTTTNLLIKVASFLRRNKLPLVLITAAVVWYNFFQMEELGGIILLALLVAIFAILKFDARIPVGYGIFLQILAAGSTLMKNETLADQIAVSSYLVLFVGIACMLIGLYRTRDRVITTK